MPPSPGPGLLAALGDGDEVLVTSRDDQREVTVRMNFAATVSGEIYLMTGAFSRKALRWERDPWVRLTAPDSGVSTEGAVHRVVAADIPAGAGPAIIDRFASAGAATPEALRQTLETGTHLLFRFDPNRRD
ncbi:MAG: hypothetical protein WCB85_11550 [Candidatus Dormiibacterota bacterium]